MDDLMDRLGLEFTPLEFETRHLLGRIYQLVLLEFTPLEFETVASGKR